MSAIKFINNADSTVDFRLFQGINRVANVDVHAGGSANVPTTTRHNVSAADLWTCYAICNGITTATVTIDDPDANVTATPNNNNAGISLIVS
jgi:hypothetical protein